MFILPNDWIAYKNAGWKRMQEPSIEDTKKYHETRMLKLKGKEEDAK